MDTITKGPKQIDKHRQKLENRSDPLHFDAIESLSDYLTVMNLLFKSISHVLSENCALTTLQYRMLLRLLSAPGNMMRITDMAEAIYTNVSTVSAAIPKLVEEKYVKRLEDSSDMRVVSIALTDRGVSGIERADFYVGEFLQGYWRSLTSEQLEAAFASSMSAVTLHELKRIENGTFRLDTAFFDTIMISRTLTSNMLESFGLRTSEFRIFLALRVLGPNSKASQIAKYLFLKSSDVTSPIKVLESKGLITKERDSDNRRTKSLCLTSKGWEMVEEMLPSVYDALLETCHSDEVAVQIHLSAAKEVVSRERGAAVFN